MKILDLIKNRQSPLTFKSIAVEKGKLDAMIEAARWAPSCYNNQPWNYILVSKSSKNRKKLESALQKGNSWAEDAPYLIVVCSNPADSCDTDKRNYSMYDCALSVMCFCIEAEHQGLRTHQMAGYIEESVKHALSIPEDYVVSVVFALGYEQDPKAVWDTLPQKIQERLNQPRTRKDPAQNFFFDKFQQG